MKNRDLIARITGGMETWREARMYVNRVQQLRNPWPCVTGHFDDALVEDGPCSTEVMARHQLDGGPLNNAPVWPDGVEGRGGDGGRGPAYLRGHMGGAESLGVEGGDGMILTPDYNSDDCSDFVMDEQAGSIWITVRNISVHIRAGDEGVSVSLYTLHQEMDDALTETWATYAEGHSIFECEECGEEEVTA